MIHCFACLNERPPNDYKFPLSLTLFILNQSNLFAYKAQTKVMYRAKVMYREKTLKKKISLMRYFKHQGMLQKSQDDKVYAGTSLLLQQV
ncbi:hypothetical protein [Bartonella sp. AU55XJBT]|uniref:hypothetical protein n=1 Tax=Bartonella sp. AU55XJBT TaxID=3019091 RepID=UPI0023608E6A|nr:hypothetical protein [Bartonella sp. AU55XJBT]